MKKLTLSIDPKRPEIVMVDGENQSGFLFGKYARRIVACVNACKGISTEDLENFTSLKILEMVRKKLGILKK